MNDFLKGIQHPADLRKIEVKDLPSVCDELRSFIIEMVSQYGGHFGASLGVVELTVALHYVYNTPHDLLVWDVGHQAYGHKILTGRKDVFHTNRKYKGISGFPKRDESEYDTFGVGHSSTSISAALGMELANQIIGSDKKVVAIIGDGSMGAGLAFEALNHVGSCKNDLLIILNDNCMSIDPNVGALKNYLTQISTSTFYNKVRDEIWKVAGKLKIGNISPQDIASRIEAGLKTIVSKNSNIFESLNIRYFGPVNGHNVEKLVETIQDLRQISGPKILHILTKKGKGFAPAEADQTTWHAPGLFDKTTGKIIKKISTQAEPLKYQDVFGKTIIELAKMNDAIMAITPAMPSGSSLKWMMEEMPTRALDVGICEQHAVTLSAGLATQGIRVFCNIYSSFMQRGYDQVIHDVAIQKLPVIFCLDRAGLVGEDGGTHHGVYDMAYMRCVPNLIVSAPMNEHELRNLMYTAQHESNHLAFVIRYPRGNGVLIDWQNKFELIPIGKGELVSKGEKIAILSIGHPGNFVVEAKRELKKKKMNPAHYNMRFVKPLDEDLLHSIFKKYKQIITIEDGTIMGGFGSAVLEFMQAFGYHAEVKMLGIPDKVIEHGTPKELYRECEFDSIALIAAVELGWNKNLA